MTNPHNPNAAAAKDTNADRANQNTGTEAHPDPITGAPGFHPVGTGVGAAGGGAAGAAAGAAIGSVVPGIGTVVGGVVGAIVGATGGGLAGKGIAESVNPTAEDAYWRANYKSRPYYSPDSGYDEYAPAYRYGWESRTQNSDRRYEDVEGDLARGWDKAKANSRLGWEKAKAATRDAWEHVDRSASRSAATEDREVL